MGQQHASSQRGLQYAHALAVILLARFIQCRSALPTAARVCTRSQQNLDAVGVAFEGCNENRRSAVVLALVDVCTGSSQQNIQAVGVAFLGCNVNRRKAVVVALVDVPARSQQNVQAVGVAFLGCNVNWKTAVVVALVDVPARA